MDRLLPMYQEFFRIEEFLSLMESGTLRCLEPSNKMCSDRTILIHVSEYGFRPGADLDFDFEFNRARTSEQSSVKMLRTRNQHCDFEPHCFQS